MPTSPAFTIPQTLRLAVVAVFAAVALAFAGRGAAQTHPAGRPASQPASRPYAPEAKEPKPALPPPETPPSGTTDKRTVREIEFRGLLSYTPRQLESKLATKVGEPFNPLEVRQDVADLAKLMRRVSVESEPTANGGVRLIFTVQEYPRLNKMQVIGNRHVSAERIETLARLKPGDKLDENTLRSLRNAIEAEYRGEGYTSPEIHINLAAATPGKAVPGPRPPTSEADLQIIIDEGEKILIDDLILKGNEAFSSIRLKLMLESKGTWWFIKNYYNDDAFEEDLNKLRNFYAAQGHFNASVERGAFEVREEKGEQIVSPVIVIEEGPKYRIKSIDVRGARLFAEEEIIEPLQPLVGAEFNAAKYRGAMDAVRRLYDNHGFLTTEIKPTYDFDHENRQVDLTLRIEENNRIYVGDIHFVRPEFDLPEPENPIRRLYDRIAPPIGREAVVREVLLEPGEVYSKRRERETARRLQKLGVFSNVTIRNEPTANPRVHDVTIEVEDAPTGGFFGGVGFGDVAGAFIYFSFTERNLQGEAKELRAQVRLGTRASTFDVTYRDRYFRDTTDIFTARAFFTRFLRPGYLESSLGTHVEIAKLLDNGVESARRLRLEFVNIDERGSDDPDEDLDDSYPVLTGRLRLTQDTRYPVKRPTEGRLLSSALEVGYGGGPLIKLSAEGDYYYRLGERFTYRFNPSVGLMPFSSDAVGLSERFFLGGNEDMRGFKQRGAGRRDDDEDEVGIGGAVKILARNELLFPVYDHVTGVYFIDVGTLGEHPFSYEFPRLSTGIGARVDFRQTTIGVDLAAPLIADGDDQTQFLHFSFQSLF